MAKLAWRILAFVVVLNAITLLAGLKPVMANAIKPLLMDGKASLYQKAISHPVARLRAAPGESAGQLIPSFSVFYVYERRWLGPDQWLRVAPDSLGQGQGWIPAEELSDWNQSLVMLFTPRTGRSPVLFFKSADDLIQLATQGDVSSALDILTSKFQYYLTHPKESPPDDWPLLAMEPPDQAGAIPYDRFYIMPILSYKEAFRGVKFLEVASIDPAPGDNSETQKGPMQSRPKFAVAFVIDTTVSMGPYIESCRQIVRQFYDEVSRNKQDLDVALGMVAFRNSLKASPQIGYNTTVVSPLRLAMEREQFETALTKVGEAPISTHSFNEDSLAGLQTAIDKLDWEQYDGRVIILLTDAGPLPVTDRYNEARLSPTVIASKALDKNIRIITLHIKSPAGLNNHDYAEKSYRKLSTRTGGGAAYLSLAANSPLEGKTNFALVSGLLIGQMKQYVFDAAQGRPRPTPASEGADLRQQATALGAVLGYSIKLDYLGRLNANPAPHLVRSWISDNDLGWLDIAKRQVPSLEVAVLLSKDQLNLLSRQIKIIIDKADDSMNFGGQDFFQGIVSASSKMLRDPEYFSRNPDANLVEIGLLGEFLEGLPYKSDIMAMRERDWYAMSIGQQDEFIHRLKGRLARYEEYDQDVDNWGKFSEHPGDWLYRVPLSMLP